MIKKLFPILIPNEKGKLIEKNETIDYSLDDGLIIPEEFMRDSIHILTIMQGPNWCNFECPNYCFTEGFAEENLNEGQLKDIINQAKDLGAKVTYWPGLGELTLSKDFWNVQEYLHKKDMKSVVFTNGSVFWNDGLAKEYIGMNSSELIEKVRELEINLYVKYWNSDQRKAAGMAGVKLEEYPYYIIEDGIGIPLALTKLIERIPQERLGIETMVSRENYRDVIENIIPLVEKLDLYCFIEPIIFSGKAKGKENELSLSLGQHNSLADIYSSGGVYGKNNCKDRQSTELVLIGDSMSPGIAIPPKRENKVIDDYGHTKNIFDIFHNEYFRKVRKITRTQFDGCLCRAVLNGEVKLE